MKVVLLIIMMVLGTIMTNAQFSIGSTVDDVKNISKKNNYELEQWSVDEDEDEYVSAIYSAVSIEDQMQIIYKFTKDETPYCYCSIVCPLGQDSWEFMIDYLKETFTKTGTSSWTRFLKDYTITVSIVIPENNEYPFFYCFYETY